MKKKDRDKEALRIGTAVLQATITVGDAIEECLRLGPGLGRRQAVRESIDDAKVLLQEMEAAMQDEK